MAIIFCTLPLILSGCGGSSLQGGGDFSSNNPASGEPTYYGTPSTIADANAVHVTIPAKFLYRQLDFTPGGSTNGLGAVVTSANAVPIPFAEFHIYDSTNTRIQQGETTTSGIADFKIPKTAGTYTLKVFSRALNDYLKISVLEDIYANTPYSISKTFTITSTEINSGSLDLSSAPVYAEADEKVSSKIEGGAFNIYFDILIANEYIRRNIQKNNNGTGVPTTDTTKWWVADKVTVFWKQGFNPYTYFNSTAALSFYSPGERKLYILGGSNGDVAASDTDHFDDSVILHEYGHFLEDTFGHTESPGGSHNGSFIIDARLAWSEGWADFLQSAILTGADAHDASASEDRLPTNKRFQYYIDTYGYKGSNNAGVAVAFNLAAVGTNLGEPDNVGSDLNGAGNFRELSIARTLYKSTRNTSQAYTTGKFGGGVSFINIWQAFSGENNSGANRDNPTQYSLRNTTTFPVPSSGLVHWLIYKNGFSGTQWDAILAEEKQNKGTSDYAYLLTAATCSGTVLGPGALETGNTMGAGDSVSHSNQQANNDFYLYYHDGSSATLSMTYTTSGNAPDLDLILYYKTYVYFEDDNWYAGEKSNYVAKSSRTVGGTTEQINLAGLPAGFYILNVKINAYQKIPSQMNGTSTYKLFKNGTQLCGTERP
ncbi:MAG: hypothetical protein ACXWQX_10915 [Bdellovibrio sp.]